MFPPYAGTHLCQGTIVFLPDNGYNETVPDRQNGAVSMPRRAKTDTVHLRVRVHRELLTRLEAIAKRNKRSVTQEIVQRLEDSLTANQIDNVLGAAAQQILDMQERLAKLEGKK
jgi:hypothetical protein